MLHLYNTLTRKKDAFIPNIPGEVSLYSCGPTVYNNVHIGNIRAVLFSDTLQRWLRFGEKLKTKWVMNITDVDDKTIRDSKSTYPEMAAKDALKKFTEHYTAVFFDDIESVGVDKSHLLSTPLATEHIEQMKVLIQQIVDNGYGYVSEGSVYLDVQKYRKDHEYGRLVSLNFDDMKSTNRVDNDEYEKESVSDFVLWKAEKEGEPSWTFELSVSTDNGEKVVSQSLPGRPGWHIECSAMSKSLFPDFPFDIHTGGVDLCFPHHEDEICQAQAGYGVDTANYWVHNEHLMVEGKKMSKSLGNFYTLADLEEKGFSAEVIRFFLVTNHYRTKVNLSDNSLRASEKMLSRMRKNYETLQKNFSNQDQEKNEEVLKEIEVFVSNFYDAMRDDLNVAISIAKVFEFLKEMSKRSLGKSEYDRVVEVVEVVENVFGIRLETKQEDTKYPAEVLKLVEKRDTARAEKNWALSDALRDELCTMGWTVSDVDNKTVLH